MAKKISKKKNLSEIESKMFHIMKNTNLKDILKEHHKNNCPYCKSDRFFYNKTNYMCQECDGSGDAVTYLMEDQLISIEKAVDRLYQKCMKDNG